MKRSPEKHPICAECGATDRTVFIVSPPVGVENLQLCVQCFSARNSAALLATKTTTPRKKKSK